MILAAIAPDTWHLFWRADALVFVTALGLLLGLWFGYPLLMWLLAALRPRRRDKAENAPAAPLPRVSMIVAAHNEEQTIGRRVQNALACDYPRELFEIIVVDDGSQDATAAIVRGLESANVRLISYSPRRGKAEALNRAIDAARGDILVFSDASNQYAPDAIRALVRGFSDNGVGAVVGHKSVDRRRGVGGGESVYWKYENWLIQHEAACGSAAVGTGEILAVRRSCVTRLPVGIMVNDDLYQVLNVLAQRKRVAFATDAHSTELPAATVRDEWERRNRITVGRWQACRLARERLRGADWFSRTKVVLHNQLRPVSALWMGVALITGLPLLFALSHSAIAWIIIWLARLQALFYLLAAAAWARRATGGRLGWFEAPYFFCAAQGASLSGWWRYLTGQQEATWRRTDRVSPDEIDSVGTSVKEPLANPVIDSAVTEVHADVNEAQTDAKVDVSSGAIVKGLAWAYGSFITGKLFVFGSIVILARLLAPRDFGEVALALSALTVLEIIGTLGLSSALVYEERDIDSAANVCFWTTVSTAIVIALLTYHFAYRFGVFFREPHVVPMLRVLVFAIVLNALGNTHDTLLRRRLDFRKKMIPDLGNAAAKGAFSILFALLKFGGWALIWGQMAAVTASLILVWKITPWRPRLAWDWAAARRMFRYAKHIYVMEISGTVLSNLDYFTIGRILGDWLLGFYTLAFRIPEVILISTLSVITRVIFPAFSRLQSDLPALRRALLHTVRYTCVITLPMAVGLILLGRDFILGFYGWKWAPSITVLQVLAIYAGIRCISHHFGDYYKATGRPDILSKIALLWWALLPASLYFGAHWNGIVGVAWAEVFVRTCITLVHFYILVRMLRVRASELMAAFAPSLEGCAIMSGAVLVLHAELPQLPPRTDLLLCSIFGAAVYFTVIALRYPDVIGSARETLASMRRRRSIAARGVSA